MVSWLGQISLVRQYKDKLGHIPWLTQVNLMDACQLAPHSVLARGFSEIAKLSVTYASSTSLFRQARLIVHASVRLFERVSVCPSQYNFVELKGVTYRPICMK